MKYLIILVTALASVIPASTAASREKRREDRISWMSGLFGGPHGKPFEDSNFVIAKNGHRRISTVTVGPCRQGEHITYLAFEFKDYVHPEKVVTTVSHGLMPLEFAGTEKSMSIEADDYIVNVNVKSWKKHFHATAHTRIGWISFQTFSGAHLACGAFDDEDASRNWFQSGTKALLYVSGASGDAIDALQGHFIDKADY